MVKIEVAGAVDTISSKHIIVDCDFNGDGILPLLVYCDNPSQYTKGQIVHFQVELLELGYYINMECFSIETRLLNDYTNEKTFIGE